ncbi:MAG: hypothetical protein LBR17_09675 [Bacteroidales bacterium]|jgi:hypothetical protein|nr:hypothetical protein [Bacteroidales bacterium]
MKRKETKVRMLCATMLLALGILGTITFVSCADEDESANNSNGRNNSLNKSYEETDLSPKEILDMTIDFSDAYNGEITMPDMTVTNALLSMEMFFNYAVAGKVNATTSYDSYNEENFEFSVALNPGDTISGDILLGAYREFLDGVIASIGNRYTLLSDMTVTSVTDTNVTFQLTIPAFRLESLPNDGIFPLQCMSNVSLWVVKAPDETFEVPDEEYLDPNDYASGLYERLPIIEKYSKKKLCDRYAVNIQNLDYYGKVAVNDANNNAVSIPANANGTFPIVDNDMLNDWILPAYSYTLDWIDGSIGSGAFNFTHYPDYVMLNYNAWGRRKHTGGRDIRFDFYLDNPVVAYTGLADYDIRTRIRIDE